VCCQSGDGCLRVLSAQCGDFGERGGAVPAPMQVCDAQGFGVDEPTVFQVSLLNICLWLESVCRWPRCPVAEGQVHGFRPVGEVIAAVVEGYLVPSLNWKGLHSSRCSEDQSAAAYHGVCSSGWSTATCCGVQHLRALCIARSCAAAPACGFGIGSLVGVTTHVMGVCGTWSL